MLESCEAPKDALDMVHCSGSQMEQILRENKEEIKLVHFTGSTNIAQKILGFMDGKCRYEDSGFNWKVIGGDKFSQKEINRIA